MLIFINLFEGGEKAMLILKDYLSHSEIFNIQCTKNIERLQKMT